VTETVPGSATRAFPGIQADILTLRGDRVEVGGGFLAIRRPWPAMLRGIWGDEERFRETYWTKWAGITVDEGGAGQPGESVYFPGDGAKRNEDGFFWVIGRIDDVLNVAGHRIGTMEVESALVDHHAVAEAAVVGKAHELKGQAVAAFVTLKEGFSPSEELKRELMQHVVQKIGAIARPDAILFSADLPKTRSGKIMRRLLKDIADGRTLGDTTTLADPKVVEKLKSEYEGREG
jgi:acetyl-CoA synthetase